MDLDILLYGDEIRDEPGLKLPRPDLLRRPYMLGPAAEIAPGCACIPRNTNRSATLWREMQAAQSHVMTPVDLGWRPTRVGHGRDA